MTSREISSIIFEIGCWIVVVMVVFWALFT